MNNNKQIGEKINKKKNHMSSKEKECVSLKS